MNGIAPGSRRPGAFAFSGGRAWRSRGRSICRSVARGERRFNLCSGQESPGAPDAGSVQIHCRLASRSDLKSQIVISRSLNPATGRSRVAVSKAVHQARRSIKRRAEHARRLQKLPASPPVPFIQRIRRPSLAYVNIGDLRELENVRVVTFVPPVEPSVLDAPSGSTRDEKTY